ncbi:PIG-L family deacetylase [Antarcticibacterium flavum]|uniref:PIG-L family deacetylase n=1 Tax=Antarcticibacterium flavum TaxID=2058175 RepID=A0A5B7X2Y5_9FLAO|nr:MULTISPECIES: PIG-L deacetylase family protein [Antarcticibacterium]MCM4160093.1 GlcNAc-PI de-N-acetylase [Antarcticibacterium sp. W02-3]QCY69650.1 PIG-L family deacetylase [Antarcticibacterium flavum]
MKNFLILFFLASFGISTYGQNSFEEPLRIIAIGAHPDDTDQQMGGTAALFAKMGHKVKFVSVTNGDAGHFNKGGGHLTKIRRAEAKEAAKRLGIETYTVLDNHDGELLPTLDIRHQIIREIRNWNADIVITHRPVDYHPDHRNTGILVQDAAYLVIVPNITPNTKPLEKNPVFLYLEDDFEKPYPFQPDIAVDITSVFDLKMDAHDAHTSQMYEWLPWVDKELSEVPENIKERKEWLTDRWTLDISSQVRKALKKWYGEDRGEEIKYAEAFEICEYGKQPTEAEILRLFPMLNNKKQ